MIFHGNQCYDLNTDSEHLYFIREPPLTAFTQLKPTTLLLRKIAWITKNKRVDNINIPFVRIFLDRE